MRAAKLFVIRDADLFPVGRVAAYTSDEAVVTFANAPEGRDVARPITAVPHSMTTYEWFTRGPMKGGEVTGNVRAVRCTGETPIIVASRSFTEVYKARKWAEDEAARLTLEHKEP